MNEKLPWYELEGALSLPLESVNCSRRDTDHEHELLMAALHVEDDSRWNSRRLSPNELKTAISYSCDVDHLTFSILQELLSGDHRMMTTAVMTDRNWPFSRKKHTFLLFKVNDEWTVARPSLAVTDMLLS